MEKYVPYKFFYFEKILISDDILTINNTNFKVALDNIILQLLRAWHTLKHHRKL